MHQFEKNETIIETRGLAILVRPVPDSLGQGIVDPRVKKVHLTAPPFKPDATLEDFRKAMGWNNIDLTQPGIRTIYRAIPGPDGEIPVRIYKTPGDEMKPCLMFFHGGGFFGGSLKTVENPCKLLAERINGIVVSVDYRLAPENPFPAGFDDCFTAVSWVYQNAAEIGVDAHKLGVCGDSAGANLAAVCALRDRDLGTRMLRYQALIYPVVNVGSQPCPDYVWSADEYTVGEEDQEMALNMAHALGKKPRRLVNLYLSGDREKAKNPYVSPIFAEDLANMPDTIIINAEYDYLRLEGEAYGRKLQKFGNRVDMLRYGGMDHAFIDKLGDYPQAEDCLKEIAKGFCRITNKK